MDVEHLSDDAALKLIDLKLKCGPHETDFIANNDAATHTFNHGNGQIDLRILQPPPKKIISALTVSYEPFWVMQLCGWKFKKES